MKTIFQIGLLCCIIPGVFAQQNSSPAFYPFGSGGQIKMIYDRRQQPQSLWLGKQILLVYNGGAENGSNKTQPFTTVFDLKTKTFSEPVKLSDKGSSDHHFCPVVWPDNEKNAHILFGCHKTPGTHLISGKPLENLNYKNWQPAPEIASSLSYPRMIRIFDDKTLVYFRTGEHRSSWSYAISSDNGKTWISPRNPVTDLNRGDEKNTGKSLQEMDEASSYHSCLPSPDGRFLHVAFCYYNDNKKSLPEKFYNPRYKTCRNLNFKFNLYYVKFDLQSGEVSNFEGEQLLTPIDLNTANQKCKIWDTDWRGTGIPPAIIIDKNGNPAFLHVLSEDSPDRFSYYYYHFVKNSWSAVKIATSNHYWNCGHIERDTAGKIHAWLIRGNDEAVDHSENKKGMDSYGGGAIEEWVSFDEGNSWEKYRDIKPAGNEFRGWKFNNIQPISTSEGKTVPGMLLFYGWKDSQKRDARAFLMIDNTKK